MTLKVSWPQALAWRLERQLLNPVGDLSVADTVRRLCGVQAQVASSAELAVRVRRQASQAGEVTRALARGTLIKTWAMRGTLHLLNPEDAGSYLSLLAAGRSWEAPSWQKWFGVGPEEIEALRVAAREALDGTSLTREELAAAVTKKRGLGHIGKELASSWGTLLKPLAWQGDLALGPSRGNRVTFVRPDQASARWAGVPEPDDAAPAAILAYLSAYGPATVEGFSNFISRGRVSKRSLKGWFAALGDRVTAVDVDSEQSYVRTEDLDELAGAKPTKALRLLPGFDQWVLGPGTDDPRIVAPARRAAVSRQAGWISPVVVLGGVVAGTWELDGPTARISWFGEAGKPQKQALGAETTRLATILGRDLAVEVVIA
ncbi:MAG TPA: crosslink repair DNA glycosylase YcaQ family protein [Candidatus Limnocylindria bacterium]|nr:crosslink repair DNA glycosylase YcaQ family protein [Candidatus Limnocylindria bacterium]